MNSTPAFIAKNFIDDDGVVLDVPNENAALPKENLLDYRLAKVLRIDGKANEEIKITLPQEEFVNTIVILNHNMTAEGTVTVKTYSDAFVTEINSKQFAAIEHIWGAGMLGAGMDGAGGFPTEEQLQDRPIITLIEITEEWTKHIKLIMNDPTNSAAYLDYGRIYAATYD